LVFSCFAAATTTTALALTAAQIIIITKNTVDQQRFDFGSLRQHFFGLFAVKGKLLSLYTTTERILFKK